VAGQIQWTHYDGQNFIPTFFNQNDYLAEFAYYIHDAKAQPFVKYESFKYVAAAEQDDINLVITLTARAMRPDLRIISRVNEASWHDRIVRAGANVVQSPYPSYGMSLATLAIAPTVLDFHALPLLGLGTEEIEVQDGSSYVGFRLSELERLHHGVHIVGLRREERLQRWTDVDDAIRSGDVLVALGTPEALRSMEDRAGQPSSIP